MPEPLTGSGGSCGSASQDEPLGLGEGDVTSVGEWRDAQAPAVPDVLVVVRDLGIADVDLAGLGLLALAIPGGHQTSESASGRNIRLA